MAREYFCCYHSYLEVMEQLNDAERGRLFTACLEYSKTGEAPELRGNERFVFPAFRSQIDRDSANYEETCRKRSKGASTRWNAKDAKASKSILNDANDAKEKEKEKTKTKANTKESIPPNPPAEQKADKSPEPSAEEVEINRLPVSLREVMRQWLEYKKQRKDAYTPVGLTALISEVINNANKYGEGAVAQVIRTSMASNYKGIVFDRLQQQGGKGRKEMVPAWADKPSQWELDAVNRMMAQEKNAGNDPELAERAEQLRERLGG